MSKSNSTEAGCGCGGCVGFFIAFLFFWAMFFGLPTSEGTLQIDLIPPYVGFEDR